MTKKTKLAVVPGVKKSSEKQKDPGFTPEQRAEVRELIKAGFTPAEALGLAKAGIRREDPRVKAIIAKPRVMKRPRLKTKEEWVAYWSAHEKLCPVGKTHNGCGKMKLGTQFGARVIRDYLDIQSYCNECRSRLSYRDVPRTYREKS